jgi:hypothetical protein
MAFLKFVFISFSCCYVSNPINGPLEATGKPGLQK